MSRLNQVARLLRDSGASLAEDAKRLSPEGVATRAVGIAQPPVDPKWITDQMMAVFGGSAEA